MSEQIDDSLMVSGANDSVGNLGESANMLIPGDWSNGGSSPPVPHLVQIPSNEQVPTTSTVECVSINDEC